MTNLKKTTLVVPTSEYRAMPIPGAGPGGRAKLGTCFVRVDDLPDELDDWMGVNPRIPKLSKADKLQGPVAGAMKRTLREEPEKFAIKNQGMYLLVDSMSFDKSDGGGGRLSITLSDPASHGLVNGGHTYKAIREHIAEREEPSTDAYVRIHLVEGIEPSDITAIAEGLNRSMQVNDPSLENLKGTFSRIKAALEGKSGAEQIAYKQGETGDVDIQQVLQIMALFDLKEFPDRKKFPNLMFGQQKAVLQAFVADTKNNFAVASRILPKLHELLVLSDYIQQKFAQVAGKWKVNEKKTGNRAGSANHKATPAHFRGGKIGASIPLGWLYPVLGALRANMSKKAWEEGRFEWLTPPEQLIDEVFEECGELVLQEHKDNNLKPAEVGRKEAAYRGCYGIVTVALAERGLLE